MTNNKESAVNPHFRPVKSQLLRTALLICGWMATGLGVLGIFLPLLPTTPFLLLAAACFLRSSPKFYHWLVHHPKLGHYIAYYLEGKGIPRKAKIYTLLLMWSTILLSMYIVPLLAVRILLLLSATGVSVYIWRQPDLQLGS
ncbi:MAG: YbaN family protein [Hahellaceae bacterium]|nr:YbaN family protein [Hahellaceae bacterium]